MFITLLRTFIIFAFREILSKAENSRTAKGISKRLIKHYEYSEKNKDTELEKVRLRNISLKTTLRKLEKILRSREQLAEGRKEAPCAILTLIY